MSQKSSVPQVAKSVSQALMSDRPESVVAYTSDPLDDAVAAAKDSLAKNLTWAVRFEISDHEGRLLFKWPEGISGNP